MKRNKIFAIGILCLLLALSACGQEPAVESTAPGTKPASTETLPASSEALKPTEPAATEAAPTAAPSATQPPATEPAVTEPPSSEVPPVTEPPTSEVPPETAPPATEHPTTEVPPETTEVPPETRPADQIIRYDDGSQIVRRFDEEGRQIEESFYYANGQLNYSDQKEFYPDGTVKREYYEEHFRDGTGKSSETLYYENGVVQTRRSTDADGQVSVRDYDEQGRQTGETDYYANGQKSTEGTSVFFPDSDQLAEMHWKNWQEDGLLADSYDILYWEDGTRKSIDRTNDDGTRWVQEARADGRTEREEYYRANGQMSTQQEYYYDENGVLLGDSYQEWLEDGSLNRCWTYTYRPDGSALTCREIYSWKRGTEYYYEFDEQERNLLMEERALDGSSYARTEWEYFENLDQASKKTYVRQTSDGQEESVTLFRENGLVQEATEVRKNGTSTHSWFDEEGRKIRQEEYTASNFLRRLEEQEFFENSTTLKRDYWKNWEEDLNDYSWSEDIYDEDGVRKKASGSNYDGSTYSCEYDKHGQVTLADYWYANGQQESHYEYQYSEESGERIFEGERYWDKDGSDERYYEDTYWPNGQRKTSLREEDGNVTQLSYNEQGSILQRKEYTETVLTYQADYVYAADGTSCTEYHRRSWDKEGNLSGWSDETYYADGKAKTKHWADVGGWDEERAYREDGTCTLEISINSAGTKVYEYVLHDNGSYVIREWHDNGLLKIYQKHDTAAGTDVYEQYLDDSTPYIRNIDGPGEFSDHRTYDTNIGMVRFQTLVKEGVYHDRYYEKGRMIVDRRYTALPDGGYDTYLGNTVWEYFEDGGVKKIRISESDEKGTTISQTVVTDDGKIGYPD